MAEIVLRGVFMRDARREWRIALFACVLFGIVRLFFSPAPQSTSLSPYFHVISGICSAATGFFLAYYFCYVRRGIDWLSFLVVTLFWVPLFEPFVASRLQSRFGIPDQPLTLITIASLLSIWFWFLSIRHRRANIAFHADSGRYPAYAKGEVGFFKWFWSPEGHARRFVHRAHVIGSAFVAIPTSIYMAFIFTWGRSILVGLLSPLIVCGSLFLLSIASACLIGWAVDGFRGGEPVSKKGVLRRFYDHPNRIRRGIHRFGCLICLAQSSIAAVLFMLYRGVAEGAQIWYFLSFLLGLVLLLVVWLGLAFLIGWVASSRRLWFPFRRGTTQECP
jgi:hypothetical protein